MKLKINRNVTFILLAILFQASSGIFMKYASTSSDPDIFSLLFNVFYILSIGCLVLQALVWQLALRHYDLSQVYPFMSITNFVVLFFSFLLFKEGITMANIVGLSMISAGIFLLSKDGMPE